MTIRPCATFENIFIFLRKGFKLMAFLRVIQNNEEFLLNTDLIMTVKKGEKPFEFVVQLKTDMLPTIFKIYGKNGRLCDNFLTIKILLDSSAEK